MNPVPACLRPVALVAIFALPALVRAQEGGPQSALRLQFLERSPWTVSAGLRMSMQGAEVKFGELGNIGFRTAVPELSDEPVERIYDNGVIRVDAPRSDEKDAEGNVFSTPGGRYQARTVDQEGNESFIGDFVAFTPGRTRLWTYRSDSQLQPDNRMAMNLFRTESAGATAAAEGDASLGVEINVARRLRRLGPRAELGLSATFGLNDINAGTSGVVTADLVTLTDFYRVYGTPPPAPYTAPSVADLLDEEGDVVLANGLETTVPLDQVPIERTFATTPDGTTVVGSWKINGAYYIVRVGPTLRWFITDRLALSLDAGLAGAFVGTNFEVTETFDVEDLASPVTTTEEDDETAFLGGFYAGGSIEYWMTNRTNAHAGAAYESLGNYQQSVNGRTAEIDIGSTVTVRFGLTTRF